MELERKVFEVCDFKAAAGDEGIIEAIVSTYSVDRGNEKVMPGAFAKSLQNRRDPIPIVFAHDWTTPIGKTLEARETPEGLYVKGQLNLDIEKARDTLSNLRKKVLTQFSFGYRVIKDSFDSKTKVRSLHEVEIFEVSPVLLGMQPETRLLSIKAANNTEASAMSQSTAEDLNRPIFEGAGGQPTGNVVNFPNHQQESWAEKFIKSNEYQNWRADKSSESSAFHTNIRLKAVLTTTTGWPAESTRSGLVVPYSSRQLRVIDLIPSVESSQNAYLFLEETTAVSGAVEVLEGGTKSESQLAFTQRTAPIRKIATWVACSDEQIDDVPGFSDYISQKLTYFVAARLEREILVGDGISPNIQGIVGTSGVQTQPKGSDPTPDCIYRAMNLVRNIGNAEPSALVIHPNDWVDVALLRSVDGHYLAAGGPWSTAPETIFGKPVIITSAMPEGTALVGDFQNFSLLIERQRMTVKIGYDGSDWKMNQKTIIGEVRVGLVVSRPTAFALCTGI